MSYRHTVETTRSSANSNAPFKLLVLKISSEETLKRESPMGDIPPQGEVIPAGNPHRDVISVLLYRTNTKHKRVKKLQTPEILINTRRLPC